MAEKKVTPPRAGQYQVFAITTKSKKDADELTKVLSKIAQTETIQEGTLYRSRFGGPTTNRKTVNDRIKTLNKLGITTAHFLLS